MVRGKPGRQRPFAAGQAPPWLVAGRTPERLHRARPGTKGCHARSCGCRHRAVVGADPKIMCIRSGKQHTPAMNKCTPSGTATACRPDQAHTIIARPVAGPDPVHMISTPACQALRLSIHGQGLTQDTSRQGARRCQIRVTHREPEARSGPGSPALRAGPPNGARLTRGLVGAPRVLSGAARVKPQPAAPPRRLRFGGQECGDGSGHDLLRRLRGQ
jgi:hypothetical protein